MVKIGDKVRFLNSVGGGIVRKFLDKEMISVEEDDGFEMPVLIKECVVIADAGEVTANKKGGDKHDDIRRSLEDVAPVREVKGRDGLNVFLAYIPQDSRMLQSTSYDCYLVNDSNFRLMFTYLSKDGANWRSRYAGMVDPNSKLHLERFDKMALNDLERVCVQFIAFKNDKDFQLKTPFSVEVRLETVKFYKLHSFKMNDYFDEEAMIYTIVKDDAAEHPLDISSNELEDALKSKVTTDRTPAKKEFQTKIKNGVVEVDLHIDELLDDTTGLSNTDMLDYQLKEFNRVMTQYKGKSGQKIVFIHGKGEGVLRQALLKELKIKYKQCTVQDASFREYGYGATMVTVR